MFDRQIGKMANITHTKGGAAWAAYVGGKVTLVQAKREEGVYDYYAKRI